MGASDLVCVALVAVRTQPSTPPSPVQVVRGCRLPRAYCEVRAHIAPCELGAATGRISAAPMGGHGGHASCPCDLPLAHSMQS
jgi:hypothetical protein